MLKVTMRKGNDTIAAVQNEMKTAKAIVAASIPKAKANGKAAGKAKGKAKPK